MLLTFEDLRVGLLRALTLVVTCSSIASIFQIPESSCCSDKALLVIDFANDQTYRICSASHDPIQINGKAVTLFAKGVDESNQDFGFKVKFEGVSKLRTYKKKTQTNSINLSLFQLNIQSKTIDVINERTYLKLDLKYIFTQEPCSKQ